jgi:aspartyl-tRNA(Asn)/glutamyl-tRNA(Gln) amidotransferase subunit A
VRDPADFGIADASAALRSGEVTAAGLLAAVRRRATATEPEIHAYLRFDDEGADRAAAAADEALAAGRDLGPMHGIPVAVKDNMVTRGVETTCASKILAGHRPPSDATAVARLRKAGAVIVGKTNLDEFAMGSSTENSAFGPTGNPWDPERVPGGSSGGSAAAVAVGSAMGAIGSDTGGSIRQPAALCGVVGMKPTYGLVSRYGLIAFASSLDQIGPFGRSVLDAMTVFEAIAGYDPADATSYRGEVPPVRPGLDEGVAGLRVGVIDELCGAGIEPDVEAAFNRTLSLLEGAGAKVKRLSLPSTAYALPVYYLIAPAECSANLARFDGVRYGLRLPGETVEQMMAASRRGGFGPEVTRRILLGTYSLSAGYFDAFYGQAQKVRTLVIEDFRTAYREADVLVTPTSPTTAFRMGDRVADPLSMYLSDVCTIPSNLAGDPSISVPVGLDRSGLPIGFQLMAPALGEGILFRAARAVEELSRFEARPGLATSEERP